MYVPKYFFEVMKTSAYFINRISSRILCNETPISILSPDKYVFTLTRHIYGCLYFFNKYGINMIKIRPLGNQVILLCEKDTCILILLLADDIFLMM